MTTVKQQVGFGCSQSSPLVPVFCVQVQETSTDIQYQSPLLETPRPPWPFEPLSLEPPDSLPP
jgi:hypothetical protein